MVLVATAIVISIHRLQNGRLSEVTKRYRKAGDLAFCLTSKTSIRFSTEMQLEISSKVVRRKLSQIECKIEPPEKQRGFGG
jgi:hypothetical protein